MLLMTPGLHALCSAAHCLSGCRCQHLGCHADHQVLSASQLAMCRHPCCFAERPSAQDRARLLTLQWTPWTAPPSSLRCSPHAVHVVAPSRLRATLRVAWC